jgi:hypothetical protein
MQKVGLNSRPELEGRNNLDSMWKEKFRFPPIAARSAKDVVDVPVATLPLPRQPPQGSRARARAPGSAGCALAPASAPAAAGTSLPGEDSKGKRR